MANEQNLKKFKKGEKRARDAQKKSAEKRNENKMRFNVFARALEIMEAEDANFTDSIKKIVKKGGNPMVKLMAETHKALEGTKVTGDLTIRKRLFDE